MTEASIGVSRARPRHRSEGDRWPLALRVVVDTRRSGAWNMAYDEVLALRLPDDSAVLRLYGWSRPTISLGRNEPTEGLRAARDAGEHGTGPGGLDLDVVRRPTGGRSVLHDEELTYALVAPVRAVGGARAAYARVNRALARAMRALGAPADVAGAKQTEGGARLDGILPLEAGPCFQSPAPGEVVARGKKLIGSAQARVGHALLQHGSVILSGDQRRLEHLTPNAATFEQPATLSDLVGPVDGSTVAAAVVRAISDCFAGAGTDSAYSEEESSAAAGLVESKYGRPEWTWRR